MIIAMLCLAVVVLSSIALKQHRQIERYRKNEHRLHDLDSYVRSVLPHDIKSVIKKNHKIMGDMRILAELVCQDEQGTYTDYAYIVRSVTNAYMCSLQSLSIVYGFIHRAQSLNRHFHDEAMDGIHCEKTLLHLDDFEMIKMMNEKFSVPEKELSWMSEMFDELKSIILSSLKKTNIKP